MYTRGVYMKQLLNTQMIFSTNELKKLGYSHYKINQMVTQKNLEKLNKRYYESKLYCGEPLDFYYTRAYVPQGVVCLMSAAVYYQLTTYRPDHIDVAMHRNKHINDLPDWPSFQLYYFNEKRLTLGTLEINEDGNTFLIYDLEKTIVDLVYYRNKVGIEEVKEILKQYIHRKDRNLNNLYEYANQLKCEKILQTYMEVLL